MISIELPIQRRARAARSAVRGAVLAIVSLSSARLSGETVFEPGTGITMSVETNGEYQVRSENPPWEFVGRLRMAPARISRSTGIDGIGEYQEIAFTPGDEPARSGRIRTYRDRPVALFSMTWKARTANVEGFPLLTVRPEAPFRSSFAGKWCVHRFDESGGEGPWSGFDGEGRTYVISAASNFMVAQIRRTPSGEIESRVNPAIGTLPAGFTHDTLLVFGNGIGRTFAAWGRALTDAHGKRRPANDADATLRSLGYWTDNGAAYYYEYEAALGYEGTLLAARDAFARAGTRLGYVQLDSWWYPKGGSGSWKPLPNHWEFGIARYEAHEALFPSGLASFAKKLGLPLLTHARWIDEKSPYRRTFAISHNVAVDRRYWEAVGSYLASSGVFAYEQDWLDQKATAAYTLEDQNAFMDHMAAAMAEHGLTMQYCLATPRHLMQSARYDNLTTARLSEDGFERERWEQFLYSSRFAAALGVWPWTDVFRSADRDSILLATLSAGVVGVGDALSEIHAANLRLAARSDGVLVKPDAPLVPTDATILADARHLAEPLVATTFTDFGERLRAVYVFASARGREDVARFTPLSVGLNSTAYVWDGFATAGRRVEPLEDVALKLTGGRAYAILVPVGDSGLAFLGDEGKFVSLGRKRVRALDDDGDRVRADLEFAAGEGAVTFWGWAPSRPRFRAAGASIESTVWDAKSGIFRVRLAPEGTRATLVVRLATFAGRH